MSMLNSLSESTKEINCSRNRKLMHACMHAAHAVSTYRQFIIENEEKLKSMPAPRIAKQYYLSGDPYLYNMDSALCRGPVNEMPREPPCETLYDVFVNILEDEWVRCAVSRGSCHCNPQRSKWFISTIL
jgi:hypothetical protein